MHTEQLNSIATSDSISFIHQLLLSPWSFTYVKLDMYLVCVCVCASVHVLVKPVQKG